MPGVQYTKIAKYAGEQYGFITQADARELGIQSMTLIRMAERKQLERCGFGLYRVPLIPSTALDTYAEATLWPRRVRGVLSHETVLDLHELGDVNPVKVHITVPRGYRVRREAPAQYVIHHENLQPDKVSFFEGLPTVSVEHAIRQCHREHLRLSLVVQAVEEAGRKNLITKQQAKRLREDLKLD